MPFARRDRFFLIVTLLVVCVGALYFYWAGGRVVSSLSHGRGPYPYTFRIREIPMEPPLQNGGYAYRCEVWWRGTLMKASTHAWDSFEARTTSISVGADGYSAVFHIDGYDITCTPFDAWSDSRWEGGR